MNAVLPCPKASPVDPVPNAVLVRLMSDAFEVPLLPLPASRAFLTR
jgi:hypothetical protein